MDNFSQNKWTWFLTSIWKTMSRLKLRLKFTCVAKNSVRFENKVRCKEAQTELDFSLFSQGTSRQAKIPRWSGTYTSTRSRGVNEKKSMSGKLWVHEFSANNTKWVINSWCVHACYVIKPHACIHSISIIALRWIICSHSPEYIVAVAVVVL